MIFRRSDPPRRYRDYTRYRKRLRADFQHRCAYCLTHESHFGGEANFSIDHYRPRRGLYARPDLENVYTNLYWTCRECNENNRNNSFRRVERRVKLRNNFASCSENLTHRKPCQIK